MDVGKGKLIVYDKVMVNAHLVLPTEKKAKILTTRDAWIPKVVNALLEGETALLPCGIGAYVLVGAISVSRNNQLDRKVAELINTQKGRAKDKPLAFDIPPIEIPDWVEVPYQIQIEKIINSIMAKPFGILVPASSSIPHWLSVEDKVHGIREKLFVWADPNEEGPLADLYQYVRDEKGLESWDFSLIATSGNLHGMPNNNRFIKAYEQLGDKDGLAYAIYDFNEGGLYSDKPTTIFSALPFIRGGEKVHVKRLGSLSKEELSSILPQAHLLSTLESKWYDFHHRTRTLLQKFPKSKQKQ